MERKYLGGSIFGKSMKVVKDNIDPFKATVICPHCGKEALYGNMTMVCGISLCPKCHEQAREEIMYDHDHHRDRYLKHDYEPYGVKKEELK